MLSKKNPRHDSLDQHCKKTDPAWDDPILVRRLQVLGSSLYLNIGDSEVVEYGDKEVEQQKPIRFLIRPSPTN